MIGAQQMETPDPQTRQAMLALLEELRAKDALIAQHDREVPFKRALIDKLRHEMAVLKRLKLATSSERFASTLAPKQKSLLEETLDANLAELAQEIERERGQGRDKTEKQNSKRTPLPPHLPSRDVAHAPEDTTCGCGQPMQRIGEYVAEKLDYQAGVFTVERHVRCKWACRCCQKLVQAPVPGHVLDKGLPTTGLLAHVLVAKFLDHRPLYCRERSYKRAGHLIARSTLAQWVGECGAQLQPLVQALADEMRRHAVLHADEAPVAMLKPAHLPDGMTHRAFVWSYCTTSANPVKAVVFEFSGFNATTTLGVTSAQCMAHARRTFNDLRANHGSEVGRKALRYHQCLFRIERKIEQLPAEERRRIRQCKSRRVLAVFHRWLLAQRRLVPSGSAMMKAIDYRLKRRAELTRLVDDGDVPISNNWVENHIRPIALGRQNWLFAGSLRAGKCAAAITSLLHSSRINGHEPYAYLRDVLERVPMHRASRVADFLPHSWAAHLAAQSMYGPHRDYCPDGYPDQHDGHRSTQAAGLRSLLCQPLLGLVP